RAAIELPRVAEEDPGAAMHRLHDAANLYVHVAVFSELADGVAILPEAHDGEAAFLVWRFGRAHIEEARAVRKLHDVVDVGGDAHIFVEQFGGVVGSDARFGCARKAHKRASACDCNQSSRKHGITLPCFAIRLRKKCSGAEAHRIFLDGDFSGLKPRSTNPYPAVPTRQSRLPSFIACQCAPTSSSLFAPWP